MRKPRFFNVAAFGIAAVCVTSSLGCGQGNLVWVGAKEYDPPPVDTLVVSGFGIDDTVHVFAGSVPFSVERPASNTGTRNIPAGYLVRERILRYTFQVSGSTVGWAPGDTLTQVVYVDTVPGPALAPGATAPISFDSIPALACGLYREQLLLDLGDTVNERNESDNIANHFFFVPSPQTFNIVLDTIDNQLFHADGPTATYR